ncbi:MAG: urease accessory protein UreD [Gammaproteobacteria bacterium]
MMPAGSQSSWQARLSLALKNLNGKTVIANRSHYGPLVIQKPFYPEGDPCHLYLLHPPGGLVSGDELKLETQLNRHSHCLMTTPGATKFYRSSGPAAVQHQTFHVANDALLEWMPQETILFNAADAQISTHVELQENAKYIGWEITCLGRTAGHQPFETGNVTQKITVLRGNSPVLVERMSLQGNSAPMQASWGLAGHTAVGTMIITPADRALLEAVRAGTTGGEHELFSATLMDDILLCRYLGPQAQTAKRLFIRVWEIARPYVQNINACVPRIWNT